jgi:hypothetical protein
MFSLKSSTVKVIAGITVVGVLASGGIATASGLIDSAHIKDGSVMNRDIHRGTISENRLDAGVRAKLNKAGVTVAGKDGANGTDGAKGEKGDNAVPATPTTGPKGDKGDKGESGMVGAYKVTYDYNSVNNGAIATVACHDPSDTAISGGVQVKDITKHTSVMSSFAGRMDWSTNTPKDGRNDGWIVQFGGGDHPENVQVSAICVPGLNVTE